MSGRRDPTCPRHDKSAPRSSARQISMHEVGDSGGKMGGCFLWMKLRTVLGTAGEGMEGRDSGGIRRVEWKQPAFT